EVSRRISRRGETGKRCGASLDRQCLCCPRNGKCARAYQAATVSVSSREGDTPDPTSPETGPDEGGKCRGARYQPVAPLMHFLLQLHVGLAGTLAGEEILKHSVIATLVVFALPLELAQDPEVAVVITATRFPEQRID